MQFRNIVATVGILVVVGLTYAADAGACETPLPDEISISEPNASLPKERAAFLGIWGDGKWSGKLCNTFIVHEIDEEGNAKATYSWGTFSGWNVWKGNATGVWKFSEDHTLRATFRNGADVTYRLEGEKLKGTYVLRGNTYGVTLVRK